MKYVIIQYMLYNIILVYNIYNYCMYMFRIRWIVVSVFELWKLLL